HHQRDAVGTQDADGGELRDRAGAARIEGAASGCGFAAAFPAPQPRNPKGAGAGRRTERTVRGEGCGGGSGKHTASVGGEFGDGGAVPGGGAGIEGDDGGAAAVARGI